MARRAGPSSTARISEFMKQNVDVHAFGDALTSLRKARSMSQSDLARAIQRSTTLVSMLETGQRRPARDLIDELARALGLESDGDVRRNLIRLAGYESSEIPDILARLVEAIAEQAPLGESGKALASADLKARVGDWLDYFKIRALFDRGSFNEAVTRYQQALARQHDSAVLEICLHMGLAETLVQHGEFLEADKQITAARDNFKFGRTTSGTPGWTSTLNAETLAVQGLVALHTGNYALARSLLEQSITIYQKALTNVVTAGADVTSGVRDAAFIGIGSSYKRLAQVALLRGEPEDALTLCLTAEAYLQRADNTSERRHWLLRTYEQLAWAYSKLGDFDLAIERRMQTRRELERDRDTYGKARNSLYLGDDYLREVKKRVSAALSASVNAESSTESSTESSAATADETCPDAEARKRAMRQAVRQVLRSDDALVWLDRAEAFYREARPALERTGQDALLGRLLANLGMTLRYKAIRDEDDPDGARPGGSEARPDEKRNEKRKQIEEIRSEALELLASALTHEKQIGHPRRLPGIYETLAGLLMDMGNESVARFYYLAGLDILGAADARPADSAASVQVERLRAGLAVATRSGDVSDAISPTVPASVALPALRFTTSDYQEAWADLCKRLCGTVERYGSQTSAKGGVTLITFSNRSDEWGRHLLEFEQEPGGRILLQNRISTSLALKLPGGLSPSGAQNHQMRHQVFKASVQLAHSSASEPAQDICCRRTVEASVANPESADQAHEEITNALDFMQRYRAGYRLDAAPYEAPLGVAAKGDHILIEASAAQSHLFHISPHEEALRRPGSMICVEFHNTAFADALQSVFHAFVDLTGKINHARHRENPAYDEDTVVWLEHLLAPQSAHPGLRRLPTMPNHAASNS